jgi:hypothetical protein
VYQAPPLSENRIRKSSATSSNANANVKGQRGLLVFHWHVTARPLAWCVQVHTARSICGCVSTWALVF